MKRPAVVIVGVFSLSLVLVGTGFAVIPDTGSDQLGVAAVVMMAQDQDPDPPGGGGIVCYDSTSCAAAGCFSLPTSLPALNASTPGSYNQQYESAGGNCGFKRCYWIFYCGCGPPLAAAVCD